MQASARVLPAARSPPAADVETSANTASPRTAMRAVTGASAPSRDRVETCPRAPGLLARVADPVDRAREVVRDQDRAVGEIRDVDRTAAIALCRRIEPAFGEHLGLVRSAVGLERG